MNGTAPAHSPLGTLTLAKIKAAVEDMLRDGGF